MGPYLDTSALAKWYLNEPYSELFEEFIQAQAGAAISRLTVVEFRCLLARRRRAGDITKAVESRVYAAFEKDVGAGFLQVYPVADEYLIAALGSDHAARPLPVANPGCTAPGDSPGHSLPAAGDGGQNHGRCGEGSRPGRRALLLSLEAYAGR